MADEPLTNLNLMSRWTYPTPLQYLGVITAAIAVFVIGLLRAPYLVEVDAHYAWAFAHLGAPILALAFLTARLGFPKWWGRARLRSRLWWPFLASLFLTMGLGELAPYVNAHLGPQSSTRIHGTVRTVWWSRGKGASGPRAEIALTGQNRTLRVEVTPDEFRRMRPGMVFHETYLRGGLGLLYRTQ